ncbi:MAG TPA: aromatic ring-hydroxylating dioxygenase subunit alpha [Chloroflexota bacterium]|nr:aromatic ring-hydroxylating dioxygenase subunit alpha [Chloroflexota bacterium]
MLSIRDNELLTQVGPGMPMGQLMRYYWQPVCSVQDLAASPFRTKEVEILGEKLVVFRDRQGRLGLVEGHCSHRRASLAYGVVENDGIRCQYHGWKFDHSGRCLEQPFEDTTHPEDRFREKCGIRGYRVEELAGLVFAYLGPEPAPLLPRWAPLVYDNAVRDIAITELPCNWLQAQENSLDPVHLEWLHNYSGSYFAQIMAGEEPELGEYQPRHQKIGFDVFEYGIIKRRLTIGNTEEHDEWRIGHPILFPNVLVVGNPLANIVQFRVPIDDNRTLHFSVYTWRPAPGFDAPKQDSIPSRWVPLRDENDRLLVNHVFNQDYTCWVSQGPIAERNLEKLGKSDEGVILFRKMLLDQLKRVQSGHEPAINVFRDPSSNVSLELQLERAKYGGQVTLQDVTYRPLEAGCSRDADKIEAVLRTWQHIDPKWAAGEIPELEPVLASH